MKNDFKRYHSLIFDCDGVILNSNQIKSDAFYNVAKQFGDIAAKKLLKFHLIIRFLQKLKSWLKKMMSFCI